MFDDLQFLIIKELVKSQKGRREDDISTVFSSSFNLYLLLIMELVNYDFIDKLFNVQFPISGSSEISKRNVIDILLSAMEILLSDGRIESTVTL